MANYVINTAVQTVLGTADADSIAFSPSAPSFNFSGSISGGDGLDGLVFNAVPGGFVTPFGRLTQYGLESATLSSIEALQFGSGIGEWVLARIRFDQAGPAIAANATLTGGAGRDSLLLMINAAGTYQMPSFTFAPGWGTNVAAPGFLDYVGLSASDPGDHTLIGADNMPGFQLFSGGTGADTFIGGNGRDVMVGRSGQIDTMIGNAGDDVFQFDGVAGSPMTVFNADIHGGEGFDRILVSGNVTLQGTEFDGIEAIRLGLGTPANLTLIAHGAGDTPQVAVEGDGSLQIIMAEPGELDLSRLVLASGSNVSISVEGSSGDDRILGGDRDDLTSGGAGDDRLRGEAGDDQLLGGDGNDRLVGGLGDDVLDGGRGDDLINGGLGNDTASYASQFRFVLPGDPFTNGVRVDLRLTTVQDTLLGGMDELRGIENLVGSRYNDILIGNDKDNVLSGAGGFDVLAGGRGADTLFGGSGGPDYFLFAAVSDSSVRAQGRDTIVDFNRFEGDRIHLALMDANVGLAGDQAFVLGGTAFTGVAGELIQTLSAGQLLVQGDVDGNGRADFAILVLGQSDVLAAASFLL
jgi:Ca2+-binding RTX toxin-like protein